MHRRGTELPLKDGDLMAQGQDRDVLVTVAHRQEPQGGERISDSQVGEAEPYKW
jgi:hypothetical protein